MEKSAPPTKHILLVEDEALIALSEKLTLERNGYSVTVANSGIAAVETFRSTPGIDLILMDIDLGAGMDGTEAAELILAEGELPLVFLSSHSEPEVVAKTERITSYGYIVKNSGVTVLLASIRMAFRLFDTNRLIGDTFVYSINGLCIHRFLHDDSGTPVDCLYVNVNDAFERHTGLKREEVLGRTIREIFPEQEAEGVISLYRDVLAGLKPSRQEIFFQPTSSWFELNLFPTREKEFTVVLNNITEQKNTEQALARSEALYRVLMERSIDGIKLLTREGRILHINSAACRMTGYTPDELEGAHISRVDPDFPVERFTRFWDERKDSLPAQIITRHRHRDGYMFPVEVNVSLVDLDGEPLVVGISRDLSEQEQTARVLEERDSQFRALFEHAPDAIFIARIDTSVIVEANDAASRLLGLPREQIIGRRQETLHPPERTDFSRDTFRRHQEQQETGRTVEAIRNEVLHADGSRIPVEVLASRVTWEGQQCLMGTFRMIRP